MSVTCIVYVSGFETNTASVLSSQEYNGAFWSNGTGIIEHSVNNGGVENRAPQGVCKHWTGILE